VYVGNLHSAADEEELVSLFSPCGSLEAVRIPRDRESGAGKGFAYVCFAPGADVHAALRSAMLLVGTLLRGRPIRVARASALRAATAAAAKEATSAAAAALAAAPTRREVREAAMQAAERGETQTEPAAPKLARWRARQLLHGAASKAPAPWEGLHSAAGGAAAVARVRTKPRWRELGRESGGVPLVAPSALRPDALARAAGAGKKAAAGKGRKAGAKLGKGKDGGTKRISGRKRPAVAQRKAAIARRKATGS
jgi:hypothetical protein